ncbi:MAG TPA: hypothetical protein VGX25_21450, partial [Actinophytocola sp.]|uniref:hypothetical protein n=1 Tax=Actinophytocola sp. TaxID=1872138 RepID=UPI002DDD56C8
MRRRYRRPAGALGLAVLGLIALAPAPAQADTPVGHGSVGSAYAFSEIPPFDVDIGPLASCTVGGPPSASISGAQARNFVAYGSGRSDCTKDPAGQAKVEVSGRRFRMDGLRHYGGPIIKISSFTTGCMTVGNGTQSNIKVTGLSGIQVPNPIPANHTVTVPGATPTDPPVARIIVNEVVVP